VSLATERAAARAAERAGRRVPLALVAKSLISYIDNT